jgi:rod shape-determining protein MreD
MEYYIRAAAAMIVLLLVQITFLPYIALGGMLPDILLPWLVVLALRRGQLEATASGFLVGLLQDAVSLKFFGLAALAKTLAGFMAGYFFNENTTGQTLGSYRFILVVGVSSLAHNLMYFLIFYQGSDLSGAASVLLATIATTLYTCVVTLLPMFIYSQRYHTSWAQ